MTMRLATRRPAEKLAERLASLTCDLWHYEICAGGLGRFAAEVRAAGGEYLAASYSDPHCGCGRTAYVVATVDVCHDPLCDADHRCSPEQARAGFAELMRRERGIRTHASAGWR